MRIAMILTHEVNEVNVRAVHAPRPARRATRARARRRFGHGRGRPGHSATGRSLRRAARRGFVYNPDALKVKAAQLKLIT